MTTAATLSVLVLLLKITGVLLAALAGSLVMQRASAGARHLVWLVALAGLMAVPALGAWGPLPIRVLPERLTPASTPAASPQTASSFGRPPLSTGTAATPAPTDAGGPPIPVSRGPAAQLPGLGTLLLALWALVALTLAARLGYGAWSVRRIVRRARPLADAGWQAPLYEIADRLGLERAPRLLRSDDVKMPFAAGLLASTIVLPAASDGWTAERRSAVLIHELGHVRRRDLIGHTIGRLACVLYWFHPLVWTAARRLRAESERACDDLALVFGARPSDYAEHLLDIVTCVRDHYTPSVALAMAHRREFEGRMLAILNPELHRRAPSRAQTMSLVGALGVVALVVGAAAPVPRVAPGATSAASPLSPPTPPAARAVFADTAAHGVAATRPAPPHVAKRAGTPAILQTADTGSHRQPDDDRAAVLARTLRTDASPAVRRVAAWGLKRYAAEDVALNALVAAVGSDADAAVREMAAWSLAGARRSGTASAVLVKALRQDKDRDVRATAVWALGSIHDAGAVQGLTPALGDTDPAIREVAAWAIGSCGPEHAPAALVAALSDHDRDVRLSGAWALYAIHDPATIGAIDAAYHHETDHDVRVGLIRALGAMGEASVDALQQLVTSPDSAVRAVAVTELAGGGASGPWPWPRPQPRPFP